MEIGSRLVNIRWNGLKMPKCSGAKLIGICYDRDNKQYGGEKINRKNLKPSSWAHKAWESDSLNVESPGEQRAATSD